jgi:hypothetical protein
MEQLRFDLIARTTAAPIAAPSAADAFRFYLGVHQPAWLTRTTVPLFLSRVRLAPRKHLPRARGPWALDSGGFSELAKHGRWTLTAVEYVAEVRRYASEIGRLEWAATMDWMCEPDVRRKTGLSVVEHQRRTADSYVELRSLAPELPWAPVLQGWTVGEYEDHLELYARRGVDLSAAPVVGVGSICRRQAHARSVFLLDQLAREGLRLHAFGFKRAGLRALRDFDALGAGSDRERGGVVSADSMAWSFHGRREGGGRQNDLGFALEWRTETLDALALASEAA